MAADFYGYKWARQFGNAPTDNWVGLLDEVDGAMVANGLRKCKELHPTWPPGAFEFIALCKPSAEDLNLLPEAEAFSQAVNWNNMQAENRRPEVLATLRKIDVYKFRHEKQAIAEAMFFKAYRAVIAEVKAGAELPPVPLPVEKQRDFITEAQQEANRKTGEQTLASLRRSLAGF